MDRVQQRRRFLQNAFLSGLWCRTSTFLLLVEAFKIFAQARVHPQLHAFQLIGSTLRMRRFNGFSHFSPKYKSATQPPHSRSELPPHSSPWTPAAYDASMVLDEEEEESEEEFEVEYVEFNDHLWGREWVPARQQYCWWLALPMGPRLAIPFCGRRGPSAEGQGDVLGTTVDTWSMSVPGACAVFFFFSTRR